MSLHKSCQRPESRGPCPERPPPPGPASTIGNADKTDVTDRTDKRRGQGLRSHLPCFSCQPKKYRSPCALSPRRASIQSVFSSVKSVQFVFPKQLTFCIARRRQFEKRKKRTQTDTNGGGTTVWMAARLSRAGAESPSSPRSPSPPRRPRAPRSPHLAPCRPRARGSSAA